MRNAERGIRNDFAPLSYANKDNYMNAERRMQNAERPHSANAPLTRKELNAERGVRSAELPHYTTFRSQGKNYKCGASASGVTQSVVVFYYIYHCERSATKRSPFRVPRSALRITRPRSLDEIRRKRFPRLSTGNKKVGRFARLTGVY